MRVVVRPRQINCLRLAHIKCLSANRNRYYSTSALHKDEDPPSVFTRLGRLLRPFTHSSSDSHSYSIPKREFQSSSWKEAILSAEKLVHPQGGSVINPKELLGKDLSLLTENIRKLLGTQHPVLKTISNYYFSQQGKHIRPLIVLLMSQATSIASKNNSTLFYKQPILDSKLSSLCDVSFSDTPLPPTSRLDSPLDEVAIPSPTGDSTCILPSQKRLAEIAEMIHTASLLHDDVIDTSMTRRSKPSANAEFGNKMAILAGDFLLARASIALARLRNVEVVELLATVISNLVEGEFMQLSNSNANTHDSASRFQYYLEKTYLKTASLISKSSRAAAVLGGCTPEVVDIAYTYGRNVGLAFQLVDDVLDFVATADQFGKPVNADLKLGLATAPVLYAAEKFPELWPLIERKFSQEGDVAKALECVHKSDGIEQTRELALKYAKEAVDAISRLPPSHAQTALIDITRAVLNRSN